VQRIRAEVKFDSVQELTTQIAKDVESAREILAR
jgi:FAD synthase